MAEANPEVTPEVPAETAAPAAPQLSHGQKAAALLAEQKPVEATTPEAPALSAKAEKLAELGFENVTSDDEAFDRLLAAYATKNEVSAQVQAALAELKQPSQPTPTQPAQDARTGKWNWAPPAVDPALLARFRSGDGWKPETPPEVRQAAESRQAYLDAWAQKLVNDPASALDPLLEDKFNAFFEQRFNQINAQQQQQTFQQKLYTENQWLFEADPVSNKPNYNALSAEGKLIDQYMREAQERGAGYELAWEFAVNKHAAAKAALSQKQTSAAQTAAERNEQLKRESLARAGGTPSRTGSFPSPSDSRSSQRNKNLSAGERFAQVAKRDGLSLSN